MEANNFTAKIKANGNDKDELDLVEVNDEYKTILNNLAPKDKGPFSLNVLCILCRNLDKVPLWKDKVDSKALLTLSIECVRGTRALSKPDQVKTLACIYHIHKHLVKMNAGVPPELMLKLSYMPFEYDCSALLNEYCKTYWNLLADRMSYIEKLKTRNSIIKLLPRLIEDTSKVVKMYDTVQFSMNILTFLVKKLHFLYNDSYSKELQRCYGEIFKGIEQKVKYETFDKLKEKEVLDLYLKFNDCFYVLAQNASKNGFQEPMLDNVMSTASNILGHNSEVSECLTKLYLNGICKIFSNITDNIEVETVLNQMLTSCLSFDKNGYEKVMRITCSFMKQLMRLFIEYCVTNEKGWKLNVNAKVQHSCLNMMYYLSSKKGEPLLNCDNCKLKSSLHDTLRLLLVIKHFPSQSIAQNVDITAILPIYYKLVTILHRMLFELRTLGCVNYEKCFRKLQTDIHNTAIILNKACYYDYSIKLFNVYVETEIKYLKDDTDLKNISRALYNKSICEVDYKLYEDALKDAFLSLVFSLPDGIHTEKYMSLVMDIKVKELKDKSVEDDVNLDELQLFSVVEACSKLLEENRYGNLKPFLSNLKVSELLKHEFCMYARLWPSVVPIAGVWRSLRDLLNDKYVTWVKAENKDHILKTLYEVVLETPNAVRTIHSDYYLEIVTELLEQYNQTDTNSPDSDYVLASLLLLKAEYDLNEYSVKYGWKVSPTTDPDQMETTKTLPQEYAAVKKAIEAVELLSVTVKSVHIVPVCRNVRNCLRLCQVWVVQLLRLAREVPALQLAHVCLQMAMHLSDVQAYIQCASEILSLARSPSDQVMGILTKAVDMWPGLGEDSEEALVFLCCAAMYYNRCGSVGVAARLVQLVQAKIISSYENNPAVKLDLAVGRLLEVQNELCDGPGGTLSAVSNAQRHYLAVSCTATTWTTRRLYTTTLKHRIASSTVAATLAAAALGLWRRARGGRAGAAAGGAAAAARASAAHAAKPADAQTIIDNRLKHILGLQPSNESQQYRTDTDTKQDLLTPRLDQLETMLESVVFKKTQVSPSLPCTSVFAYKMPEFLRHTNCECYACENPNTLVLACMTSGLEASTYFRAKEFDIARNYFEGTVKSFVYAEDNMKRYFKKCRSKFEGYVVDMVEKSVDDEFRHIQIDIFVNAGFFELAQGFYERADDVIVRIHELIQDMKSVNPYLKNEVLNLMTTAANLRKTVKKPIETGLEIEMECLKLSVEEEPKTPVVKPKNPPKIKKNVVKNDELPNVKRKVIKLNLDDATEEQEVEKPGRKRAEFKIPVPVASKPVLESITPRTRSKPDILITKPTEEAKMTPKTEYSTPISTPADEFFTPMTSIKTYSKKLLRNNIVKNLEAEFFTPKGDKENSTVTTEVERLEVPKCSGRQTRAKVADKRTLKRATSPGKLAKEVKATRSRLRNPGFKVHEDK